MGAGCLDRRRPAASKPVEGHQQRGRAPTLIRFTRLFGAPGKRVPTCHNELLNSRTTTIVVLWNDMVQQLPGFPRMNP
jgi:hypothetical protein